MPRRSHIRRQGGAISDYIPSSESIANTLDSAASYIPGYTTAKGYYNTAKDTYNSAIDTYNKGKQIYEQVKPAIDAFSQITAPPPKPASRQPPPLPPGGPPTDARSRRQSELDAFHNKQQARLNQIEAERAAHEAKVKAIESGQQQHPADIRRAAEAASLFGKVDRFARKVKPVSFIDNGLDALGLRGRVRQFFKNRGLDFVNDYADNAIRAGYGRRRGHYRRQRAR